MAYQSLYRRYRPQRFSEVRGQEHLTTALRNAVREGRVGHAYLFCGPRGTGKTTTARILAKALNCTDLQDGEPCGACESCLAIEQGRSFDLHELDAASNNGVDAIRTLIERAALGTPGRTKVYILDEVHMLSKAASNALLKTLEEPPEHVVFVLATTDPQAVLPTIRSRTQQFDLKLLPAAELHDLVDHVARDASLDVTPEQIDYVIRKGAGSARDTLSALDQIAAAGLVPDDDQSIDELVEGVIDRDAGRVLLAVQAAVDAGREPRIIGERLLARLRDAFLSVMGGAVLHLADDDLARVADQGQRLGARATTHALEALGEALVEMRQAPDPRIPLEVALIRVTRPEADPSPSALLDRIERLERAVSTGAPVTAPAVAPPPAEHRPRDENPPATSAKRRPADAARQVLASTNSSNSATPSKGSGVGDAPKAKGPSKEKPKPGERAVSRRAPAKSKPALGAVRAGKPPAGEQPDALPRSAEGFPTRDELTLAWGDVVLATLDQGPRTRFRDGRFVAVEAGTALFAVPSPVHLDRAKQVQHEVELALANHFGQPVPLRLVVEGVEPRAADDALADTAEIGGHGDTDPEPIIEDIGPIDELEDADDVAATGVERLAAAFPGAELVPDEPGRESGAE